MKMKSFLVILAEPAAVDEAKVLAKAADADVVEVLDPFPKSVNPGRSQRIIVQDFCEHGMQAFVDSLVANDDPRIVLDNPVVVGIDARSARHVPVMEPAGE